jgi:hypothetical protein
MSIHRITPIHLIKTRGLHDTQSIPSGLYKVASGKVSVGRSAHVADIKARELLTMDNKRATWRQDATMPVNRVAQAIGDVPGGGAETGYVHERHTSAIVWDRHSQKWLPATCATAAEGVNKTARLVKMVR